MKYFIVTTILLTMFASAACKSYQDHESQVTDPEPAYLDALATSSQGFGDIHISQRAFPYLTESSKKIFERMVKFVDIQKKANFQNFSQKLECTRNVSHVLFSQDLHTNPGEESLHIHKDVGSLGNYLESHGYKRRIVLEHSLDNSDYHQRYNNIADFWEQHFASGVPTGTVVFGISRTHDGGSSAHAAIVGDYNQNGTIMIYHNNWFRPESVASATCLTYQSCSQDFLQAFRLQHFRVPFMVSPENLYNKKRPREWMATPWIRITRDVNDPSKVTSLSIPIKYIDDLDLSNVNYRFEFYVPKTSNEEEVITSFKDKHIPSHSMYSVKSEGLGEDSKLLCQTNKPLREIFSLPLPEYKQNSGFEFYPVATQDSGAYAYFYVGGEYYGSMETSEYFINKSDYTCKTFSQWLTDYRNVKY